MKAYQNEEGYLVIDGEKEEVELHQPLGDPPQKIIITNFTFIATWGEENSQS